jgi:hypothetical protein
MDNDETSETNSIDYSNSITPIWTTEHEQILIEWADKAMCYRWLHTKSHAKYYYLNTIYTIPVIILSTVTGTANFAQDKVPIQYQSLYQMVVGALNISAGIITTVQQFLKIGELSEGYRVSSIAWDKFYRNIKIELAKHPDERQDPSHMLKAAKEEFDRLMETCPPIPDDIVASFKKEFKRLPNFDEIIVPEICGVLIPTNDTRNKWYMPDKVQSRENSIIQMKNLKEHKIKKMNDNNIRKIKEFINSFKQINNRDPLDTEIISGIGNDIDEETIKHTSYLMRFNTNNEDNV